MHSLRGLPNVVDIRSVGLAAAIELAPRVGLPGRRAYDIVEDGFWNRDMIVRQAGETIVLTPPLIVGEDEIEALVARLRACIEAAA